MARDGDDFFTGYVEEVQTYIPIIANGIEELRTVANKVVVFDEVYRLVHIIRGASAMVGVDGLGRIAQCMETALEEIRAGRLALAPEAFAAMLVTVDCFTKFCRALRQGIPVDEELLLAQTRDAFAKVGSGEGQPLFPEDEHLFFSGEEISVADSFASSSDEELVADFRVEAEEHLANLHEAMQHLGVQVIDKVPVTGAIVEVLRKVRRSVHTIKGASAVIGLHDLAAYGHLVEDILDGLHERSASLDQEMVLLLTEAIDLLATMISAPSDFDEQRAEKVLSQLYECIHTTQGEQGEIDGQAAMADFLDEEDSLADSIETVSVLPESILGTGGESLQGHLFSKDEKQMLLEGFLEEAEEHLHQVHQSIQSLEDRVEAKVTVTPEYREEIRKIRRAVHTIKGAAAVIGLNEISFYAHGVEDVLDWLYEEAQHLDPSIVSVLAESMNLLGLLVESPLSATLDRQTDMHRRLHALVQGAGLRGDVQGGATTQLLTDPSSPAVKLEEVSAVEARQPILGDTVKTFRVGQAQLDSLVNLANELLVGVSGFDQNMGLFKDALDELELTTRRLKDIALELETKFEVKALDRLSQHFAHLDSSVQGVKESHGFVEFDALELDRYTQLNLIIRSLNESAIDVAALHANLGGIYSGIGGDINRQHRVIRELQVQMMRTRMSPMSTLTPRLSRTMRDVASRLGKKVRLVMEGERVELDRMVWEKLADPFMHLVRNAIHHGVEPEDERLRQGKPASATITISGQREGNTIVIRFRDDGRGLDFDAIREKARQFGLGAQADTLDEQQLTDLIFYPGFSTKTISEMSGRGVGMDVVKENVQELQGSIAVESGKDEGTAFVMRIPLTLGVSRALLVRVDEVTYAIALNDIKDIQRVARGDLSRSERTFRQGETTMPWYSLRTLLGQGDDQAEEDRPLVLVLNVAGKTMALSIPLITGQKELVIKGLGSHLRSVFGVSGAAIMGDGSIVPVLNISDLVEAGRRATSYDRKPVRLEIPDSFTVMIVDDSISIRRVMGRLVAAQGWIPIEAKDGLDAMEQLNEIRPDCIALDIEMPRMNGFEFLGKLANVPRGNEIPVIMLTSRTSAKHREKALQLGAGAFLNKPCKDEDFVAAVLRLTGRLPASEAQVDDHTRVRV